MNLMSMENPKDVQALVSKQIIFPSVHTFSTSAIWSNPNEKPELLSLSDLQKRIELTPALLCHAPSIARKINCDHVAGYDVLELFAFVHPTTFTLPTLNGIANTLKLETSYINSPLSLLNVIAKQLISEIIFDIDNVDDAHAIAKKMTNAGWLWGPIILKVLETTYVINKSNGLAIWKKLPEWSELPSSSPAGELPVEPNDARQRLSKILGKHAEPRPTQADYASAASLMFLPQKLPNTPNIVLAEAGTGTGKTLGYIAPASLWSERNNTTVWISTYTRNLQKQIDQELDHLFPDPNIKKKKVVIRKGRENYLCLLNMEEAVGRFTTSNKRDSVALGLLARWATETRDGDFGGDFPSWLVDLVGPTNTTSLSDRRGECIFSSCSHYSKCYIEHSTRKAQSASLVVANHALVMIQASLNDDENHLPTRYIFDEGHHLFEAADTAFGNNLSGREGADLRRWLLGTESLRMINNGRSRGLRERASSLIYDDDIIAKNSLEEIVAIAHILPAPGWMERIKNIKPSGPMEKFLNALREQVYARNTHLSNFYSIESYIHPLAENVESIGKELIAALEKLVCSILKLHNQLQLRLDVDTDKMEIETRIRVESMCRGLKQRGEILVSGWINMLKNIYSETPDDYVDWFAVERIEGRDFDAGMFRRWVDPTLPFSEKMSAHAHGILFTSATLTGRSGNNEEDWQFAEQRTGSIHFPKPAIRSRVASPFDYTKQTKVIIINDINRNDPAQVAASLRELFIAASGGSLGLFTSIARLREVYKRIALPLEKVGLPLYAQHVDVLNVASLVDIFRAESDACLLGTDAVRDGIDVPGESLRLLAFDRVPWPRPTILHKARRAKFGGSLYDDTQARLRLSQAYGRLIRGQNDKGIFVILDSALPSRLLGAFPEGVNIDKIGLVDAIENVSDFLSN
jgi:ATP-dependent DNA helicase DinG